MRQFILALVSAFVLASMSVATAFADSHPTTGAATGTTTEGTTVTAVPQTGVGSLAVSATHGIILMLLALAALMAFASLWQGRRA
jgi:hypothetical protein